jgi:hypothetical protein
MHGCAVFTRVVRGPTPRVPSTATRTVNYSHTTVIPVAVSARADRAPPGTPGRGHACPTLLAIESWWNCITTVLPMQIYTC